MIDITYSNSGSLPRKMAALLKIQDGARDVLYRNVLDAQRELQTYPAQPSRTRAKTFNTYVRGVGSYPRSAFGLTKAGTVKLKAGARKGKFGTVRYTSQNLGKKWYVAQSSDRNEAAVIIGNNATYGKYVQGKLQTGFHAMTGWVRVEDAVNKRVPKIRAELSAMLKRLTGGGE